MAAANLYIQQRRTVSQQSGIEWGGDAGPRPFVSQVSGGIKTPAFALTGGDIGAVQDTGEATPRTITFFGDIHDTEWIPDLYDGSGVAVSNSSTNTLAIVNQANFAASLMTGAFDLSVDLQGHGSVGIQAYGFLNIGNSTGPGNWAMVAYYSWDRVGSIATFHSCQLLAGSGTIHTGDSVRWGEPRANGGFRSNAAAESLDQTLSDGYTYTRLLDNAGDFVARQPFPRPAGTATKQAITDTFPIVSAPATNPLTKPLTVDAFGTIVGKATTMLQAAGRPKPSDCSILLGGYPQPVECVFGGTTFTVAPAGTGLPSTITVTGSNPCVTAGTADEKVAAIETTSVAFPSNGTSLVVYRTILFAYTAISGGNFTGCTWLAGSGTVNSAVSHRIIQGVEADQSRAISVFNCLSYPFTLDQRVYDHGSDGDVHTFRYSGFRMLRGGGATVGNVYTPYNKWLDPNIATTAPAWVSGQAYSLGDTVSNGGNAYHCLGSTSGVIAPPSAPIFWKLITVQGAPREGHVVGGGFSVDMSTAASWISGHAYTAGTPVTSGGLTYVCILAVTSATAPASDATHWGRFTDWDGNVTNRRQIHSVLATYYNGNGFYWDYCTFWYSDNGGHDWAESALRWSAGMNMNALIQSVSPFAHSDGNVYAISNNSNIAMRCLQSKFVSAPSIWDTTDWQYYDGVFPTGGWTGTLPSPATAKRWDETSYNNVVMGYMASKSVFFSTALTFGTIQIRFADQPEGPWTAPQTLAALTDYSPNNAHASIYGGWPHPFSERFGNANGKLYFVITLLQPYQIYLVELTIGDGGSFPVKTIRQIWQWAAGSRSINEHLVSPTIEDWNYWTLSPDTLTRTGNQTATCPGDRTGRYRKGTKLWWKESGVLKYLPVKSSSYSAGSPGTTTITFFTTTDYVMAANPDAQSVYYSQGLSPEGWPGKFTFTVTPTGFGTLTNSENWFSVRGNEVTVHLQHTALSTATAHSLTAPVASAAGAVGQQVGIGYGVNNVSTNIICMARILGTTTSIDLFNGAAGAWTAGSASCTHAVDITYFF